MDAIHCQDLRHFLRLPPPPLRVSSIATMGVGVLGMKSSSFGNNWLLCGLIYGKFGRLGMEYLEWRIRVGEIGGIGWQLLVITAILITVVTFLNESSTIIWIISSASTTVVFIFVSTPLPIELIVKALLI